MWVKDGEEKRAVLTWVGGRRIKRRELGVTSSFMGGRRPGEGSDCGLVRVGGQSKDSEWAVIVGWFCVGGRRMGEVVPYLPTIGK